MEIELKNIKYENNKEILLEDINITFKEATITSIIGSTGSGKSLIGYILAQLIEPTKGTIRIDGIRNYNKSNIRKKIGYVFQNPEECFFCKTVYEELAYSLNQSQYKLDKEQERIKNSLKMVGLKENILNQNPNELSSGEKEALAISIALILNPKVLILDEPTIYLDSQKKRNLIKILRKLKREYYKTIIILSNDIEFVYELSDDLILLNQGKIVLNIKNKELLKYYEVLKENNMEIPPIIRLINWIKETKKNNLEKTNDINELIKDIYRNVKQ